MSNKNSSGTPLIEWTIFPLISTPDASRRVLEPPVFLILFAGFFLGLRDEDGEEGDGEEGDGEEGDGEEGDGEEEGEEDEEGEDEDGRWALVSSAPWATLVLMPSSRSPCSRSSAFPGPYRQPLVRRVPAGSKSACSPALAARAARPKLPPGLACASVALFAVFFETSNRRRALTALFDVSNSFSTLHSSSLLTTVGRPLDWLDWRFFFRSTGADLGRPTGIPRSRIA